MGRAEMSDELQSVEVVTRRCDRIDGVVKVSDRQEKIPGWKQEALTNARVMPIGLGTIGSEISEGCVRKGTGTMIVVDGDTVGVSNLNAQKYVADDLYKNKAVALVERMQHMGFLGTELIGVPAYSDAVDLDAFDPSIMFCCVDLQVPGTRLAICKHAWERSIPAIFVAIGTDASSGYVFVQESAVGTACWSCLMRPETIAEAPRNNEDPAKIHCPGDVGVCTDIVKVVSGFALYAMDTILMSRKRNWNYRRVALSSGMSDAASMIHPRKDCPVCKAC